MQSNLEGEAGVREGEVLAGKYRVERVLGIGGMGIVVAAHHVQLDTKVAIKFLLPSMLRNQEVIGRFAREARAAVKITSEHVARVFDVGTLETGAPYMVMEFLEGGDLGTWLQERGPLPVEQAIDFVLQASVAVADAHGVGIVHRDLKPANLFCVRRSDGTQVVKVLDFGISKVSDFGSQPGMAATKTSAVMGSPLYMSPEQMQSARDVDAQTDVWALGVILYELLTGTTPFLGDSYAEVAIKVATAPFAPLRNFRPDAPSGLEAVIAKCLEKDKRLRYGNVAKLALGLAEFSPKRSRASIERIVGIIQASGLSESVLAMPPTPPVRPTPQPAPAPVQGQFGARNTGQGTSVSPVARAQTPFDAGVAVSLGTMAPSANTAYQVPGVSRLKGAKVAAIVGVAAAVSLTAVLGVMTLPSKAPGAAAGSAIATASVPATPAPVVLEPQKPVEISAVISAAPATAALVPQPPGSPSGTKAPHGDAKKATPPAAKPAAGAPPNAITAVPSPVVLPPADKPDCNPNYFFDAQGQKRFKHECFAK
ncbi:MAG TPA: serine/threonine-protein kinase [Polyangiaceae bacterium]|nr:serine/threonine-protein kinase [Polyangiaceae bacterium]